MTSRVKSRVALAGLLGLTLLISGCHYHYGHGGGHGYYSGGNGYYGGGHGGHSYGGHGGYKYKNKGHRY